MSNNQDNIQHIIALEELKRQMLPSSSMRKLSERPNILVCGYTGAGKTSLIRAIFGGDVVPESAIGHSEPCTLGFVEYEASAFRIFDSQGMEMGQETEEYLDFLKECVDNPGGIENLIHIVWYCIDGSRARLTKCDRDIISGLGRCSIAVVTKDDTIRDRQRKELLIQLQEFLPASNIVFTSGENGSGLDRLGELTKKMTKVAQKIALRQYHDNRVKVKYRWGIVFGTFFDDVWIENLSSFSLTNIRFTVAVSFKGGPVYYQKTFTLGWLDKGDSHVWSCVMEINDPTTKDEQCTLDCNRESGCQGPAPILTWS